MDFSAIDLSAIEPHAFLLAAVGILILGFAISIYRGRDFWLLVDFVLCAAMGLPYFFPRQFLSFGLKLEPDGNHMTCMRAFAACMIGDAVARHFCRSSKDNSTQVFLLLSRFIERALLSIIIIHSQLTGEDYATQMRLCNTLLYMLWMLGSAIFYFKARYAGGHAQLESQLNFHLRVDAVLVLLVGCTTIALPDTLLKILTSQAFDRATLDMVRATGGVLIASSILGFLAPGFLFDWDKRALLVGRIVTSGMTVLALIFAAANYEGWGRNLPLFLLKDAVLIVNALLGYYAPHETERYKSK